MHVKQAGRKTKLEPNGHSYSAGSGACEKNGQWQTDLLLPSEMAEATRVRCASHAAAGLAPTWVSGL